MSGNKFWSFAWTVIIIIIIIISIIKDTTFIMFFSSLVPGMSEFAAAQMVCIFSTLPLKLA